jgi:hypothetical protein
MMDVVLGVLGYLVIGVVSEFIIVRYSKVIRDEELGHLFLMAWPIAWVVAGACAASAAAERLARRGRE